MRKTKVLAPLMLALLTMMAIAPMIKATQIYYFAWDGVEFVKGTDIKYPHPDRDYYGISPYSSWSRTGVKLYHYQLDRDTSDILPDAVALACLIAGTIIGTMIGPPYGTLIGGITGAVLGFIAEIGGAVLKDESGCIWWWTSTAFLDWLITNAWWLGPLAIISPILAEADILATFLLCGYLRVGSATFYDAVGAGQPVFGDVNEDGQCNIIDVQLVKLAICGLIEEPRADLNRDGNINVLDLKLVKLAYMGYI